jgi:FkbM family methyltransferase
LASFYQYKARIRNLFQRAGLRRRRRPDSGAMLLAQYGVQVVFDVGANNGQYARRLQAMGFQGRIVSFEPLLTAYQKLAANANGNPSWDIVNIALGAADGESLLHVAGNSQSSSLKDMLPDHRTAAPSSAYVGQQAVSLRRLDSLVDLHCRSDERCFLKLDVQGAEREVLQGALQSLSRFVGIQLELAMTPLYDGEAMLDEMLRLLADYGYCPMSLANGFIDPRTKRLLQVDGIFYRREEVARLAGRAA